MIAGRSSPAAPRGLGESRDVTTTPVAIRPARLEDAPVIAAIHADNWRRHYRGAYSDAYLDGDLDGERAREWTRRLEQGDLDAFTLVAEREGRGVGFVHVKLGADDRWGALVDNLHVGEGHRGDGIGTRLLLSAARVLLERTPSAGVWLTVQEQNVAAQSFYRARGGRVVERIPIPAPRDDPRNLAGAPYMLRVVWADPAALAAAAA